MRNLISFLVILFLLQSTVSFSQSITKPEILKFGETKSSIMLALDAKCAIVNDMQIDPVQLPTANKSQSQVDCVRFKYAGKKRKMELVFANGILDMVRILTEAEEEDSLIAGFTKLYGKPTLVKEDITFFLNDGVAVRNDPHEVLFISDRLKPSYKVWLEQEDQ